MQAGARRYPEPPLPGQHLDKPGLEAELALQPMYDAPHYKGSEKLLGKVALITGGDSGIGRAVAVLYAREGADVAVAYLDEHEDAAETKHAVEREGRRCILISGDVANPAFCREAVNRTVSELSRLDILVNNAAFQEHVLEFEELSEAHFDLTIKTNLYGYFHMAKAAVPVMKPGSAIVMTGSVTGLLGNKSLLDYSMTKGGPRCGGRPSPRRSRRPSLPHRAELLELHHGRDPPDHWRLFRRLNVRGTTQERSRRAPLNGGGRIWRQRCGNSA